MRRRYPASQARARLRRVLAALLFRPSRHAASLSPIVLPLTVVLACALAALLARASIVARGTPLAAPLAHAVLSPRRVAQPFVRAALLDEAPRVPALQIGARPFAVLPDSPPRRPGASSPLLSPARVPPVLYASLRAARPLGHDLALRDLIIADTVASARGPSAAARSSPTRAPSPTAIPTATSTPSPTASAPPTSAVHVAQVYVTGYALSGVTSTGAEAGPGICAVDPSFIPFGAHIVIDGLGSCVAADSGPSVVGAHVDVWVPTVSAAYNITGWYTVQW